MLMRRSEAGDAPLWDTGDIVVGEVGDGWGRPVVFGGEIVRTDRNTEGTGYAVKMTPTPDNEEA